MTRVWHWPPHGRYPANACWRAFQPLLLDEKPATWWPETTDASHTGSAVYASGQGTAGWLSRSYSFRDLDSEDPRPEAGITWR